MSTISAKIGSEVQMIAVQFNFSNGGLIPYTIKHLEREPLPVHTNRKARATGVLVVEPTEKCCFSTFLDGLLTSGFELVDAFYEERLDAKDPKRSRTYHCVRFWFARCENVNRTSPFNEMRPRVLSELQKFITEAFWRVRVYDNPFYKDGEEVPDQRAITVNLEARVPLKHPDGKPVVEWQRDHLNQKVGDGPVAILPNFVVTVGTDGINLTPLGT